MGEVLVLLSGDTSCYSLVIHSYVYAIVIMQHGKGICLLIVNGDRHLVRDLEDRLVPINGSGDFWFLNYFELHEMILKDQGSEIEVRHECTRDLQD